MTNVGGQLLVAAPTLIDPNFRRTVVLIAEHGDEGAMGVVLNRPTETTVGEALPALAEVLGGEDPVFHGGPVGTHGVVVLAEFEDASRAAARIAEDVGFVSAEEELADLEGNVRRARVFAGHAAWGPGQLDAELGDEGWIVADHRREDLFSAAPEGLWGRVLERKGGQYALVARMPFDPSLN